MTDFSPTPEQLAIIEATTSSPANLIISALAGAAKTSTLVMIAEALAPTRMLCLAFNRQTADEMKRRLPDSCEAKTLNSLGFSIWRDVVGRKGSVEGSKTYDILSALIGALDPAVKAMAYNSLTDLLDAIRIGKSSGWIPDTYPKKSTRLLSDAEFFASTPDRFEPWAEDLIIEATIISLNRAFEGHLDFDDQILMPTVFPAPYPRYPVVLIDEAQDLSPLNHVMLRKLVGARRIIAVGDPCQAIYGFRGASANSMTELETEFKMKKLLLSVSFRCPRAVVEHARWRAPNMQYPTWAKPGSVNRPESWSLRDIPEGAAIICRNNSPLFSLAIKMLKNGRYPELIGNDIGKGMLKILRKLGPPDLPREQVLQMIELWLTEKKAKTRSPGTYEDRASCMRVFAEQGKNLDDAITYAQHVFNSQGSVKLMTAHKSKGLEFDDVFIFEEALIRDEGQDKNLRYVAITRAKSSLTYIDLEGFEE